MNISSLPPEILTIILDHLSRDALINFSMLSLFFRNLCQRQIFRNKSLSIIRALLILEKSKRSNTRIKSPARYINTLDSSLTESKIISDEVIFRFISLEPRLEVVKLIDCYIMSPLSISCIVSECSFLKSIEITRCSKEVTLLFLKILPKLKNLERLSLESLFPISMNIQTSATEVSLSKPRGRKEEHRKDDVLIINLQKTKTLKLINLNVNLNDIWPDWSCLTEFEWSNGDVNDSFLRKLCNSCELRRLLLTNANISLKGTDS